MLNRDRGPSISVRSALLIPATVFLLACSEGDSDRAGEASGASAEAQLLVEAWLEAFATNDHSNIEAILSPDVVVYGFGGVERMTYSEVVEKMEQSASGKDHSPFVDRRWLPLTALDDAFAGEGVLFWGTSILNLKNGVSVSLPIHIAAVVEDDRIVAMHFYYDVYRILEESGYTVSPPDQE